eukprot:TRINITY_DN8237_c0_g1_i1.p1 TRINITY_DN8237_c0_g1~~TRINITY_DN8237_c0_g1_i1.p1  ORF type:complete len:335 (-),score=31.03 TRINITY_DN8237_c0_g1_i1:509-1513(-)
MSLFRSFCSTVVGSTNIRVNPSSAVLMFPGQGSQFVGMGKELFNQSDVARSLFRRVDEALKKPLSNIMFEGPESALQATENAQPAILTHSIVLLELLKIQQRFQVDQFRYVMGHSLGEYTAAAALGLMPLEEAAKVVRLRGKAMQLCVERMHTGMVALFPCSYETAEVIASQARTSTGQICEIANINSPSQVVLSGHLTAIDKAIEFSNKHPDRIRCKKLNVSAPFHSSLMENAKAAVAVELQNVIMSNMKVPIPFISNVNGQPNSDPAQIRENLLSQITATVRWRDCVDFCSSQGIDTFVEIGPGRTLSSLVKQCVPTAKCISVNTCDSELHV